MWELAGGLNGAFGSRLKHAHGPVVEWLARLAADPGGVQRFERRKRASRKMGMEHGQPQQPIRLVDCHWQLLLETGDTCSAEGQKRFFQTLLG